MKAMILAAGLGKRMRPLTDTLPKPLIPVRGKPLIAYHLEALARAGITQVVINLAYRGDQIKAFVGDGTAWGVQVVYSQEPEPLETGGAIVHAAELLGKAPFVLLNADIFTDFDFAQLLAAPLAKGALGRLVLVPNPDFKPVGDFAISAAGHLLTREAKEPGHTFAGISVLHPSLVLNYPKRRDCFGLAEVFNHALQKQQLTAQVYSGAWSDVGTPERLRQLN
ncbi:N-acetylmuramate alpha-1-phosphate uridylyltransferase MurU [Gilvimarinus polysaccharolyticus]|uniref:N-acetylmuramate alpha-1-phosphate uridylyltransferase MurU n=1 Tax=Gilvimarinus polysaccharolyticus TaxID=863921 RepID=UPI0006731C5B|nr:nucleotidyltransferase family protein [Gilvimarinus polysaccharolyticus]